MCMPSIYYLNSELFSYLSTYMYNPFLTEWVSKVKPDITRLRFIDNGVITGIQWIVSWWVVVHSGQFWGSKGLLQYNWRCKMHSLNADSHLGIYLLSSCTLIVPALLAKCAIFLKQWVHSWPKLNWHQQPRVKIGMYV